MEFNSGFKGLTASQILFQDNMVHCGVYSVLVMGSLKLLPFCVSSPQTSMINLILMDPCIVDDSVEIPTRCSFLIEFIIPKFFKCSTCFRAVHRSSSGALNSICSFRFICLYGNRPLSRLNGQWIRYVDC